MTRDLSCLAGKDFDLLIIGGGIVGAGVAWDAALRGFSVALVEKGDFASGTSSKTTKLIHGGIRYLEQMEFRLVRQAAYERNLLLKNAPGYVKPLPFLIPVVGSSPRPWPLIWLGTHLYSWISGKSPLPRYQFLNKEELLRKEPVLSGIPVRKGVLYYDAQMDDVGLVLATLEAASQAGAVLANHSTVTRFLLEQGRVAGVDVKDKWTGNVFQIRARVVVNAAGPWADRVRQLADPSVSPIVRKSKGIHIVYPDLGLHEAILLSAPSDQRIFFLIPWRGSTLIGTTDTDYDGDPDDAKAEDEDIDYLIRETNRLLPHLKIEKGKIISTFAGVRPLVAQERKDPWAVSRAHLIHEDGNGLVSVVGGKFTTYRKIAEEVVDCLARSFPQKRLKPCRTRSAAL